MRKRSMAFMMSLLIVLCTTPFVNANTGTEFDDSKSVPVNGFKMMNCL